MPGGIERVLCVLPFFHVFAMTGAMNIGIACGAEMLLMPRFDHRRSVRAHQTQAPDLSPRRADALHRDLQSPRGQELDLSSIKICVSGGASLPLEVKTKFEAATGCKLMEGYGLSETSPVLDLQPARRGDKPARRACRCRARSSRSPRPRTRSPALPQGERGEICARGPQVMPGYWHKPEETAQVMAGGRFHTGDVGYLDADGYLFIVDRIKDIIIAGGLQNLSAPGRGGALSASEGGAGIVIGVPDPYRGQTVKAVVQPRAGETITEDELLDFLKDKVSPIERPR